ncbi:hypothetical protein ACWCQN_40905 [Streptomyces sp. NPDC001984]
MTPLDDDLLSALSAARPVQQEEPTAASPEAQAMLTRIFGTETVPRRRRRRWMIAAPAGVAAAAAVAVGLVWAPGKPAPHTAPPASPTNLRTAVLAAFEDASGSMSHAVVTWTVPGSPKITFERWTYPGTAKPGQLRRIRQLERVNGSPSQDVETIYTVPGGSAAGRTKVLVKGELIDIEYQTRSWSRQKNTEINAADDAWPAPTTPDEIRQQIADGHFTVKGKVSLEGRAAIELTWSPAPQTVSRLWVDAKTYLPLKSSFDGKAGRLGDEYNSSVVTVYDILPAIDANLALLKPPIPAGFKETAAPTTPAGG